MRVEFVSVLEQDNLLKTHLNIFLKEKKNECPIVLIFESVDEILWYDHSNQSY